MNEKYPLARNISNKLVDISLRLRRMTVIRCLNPLARNTSNKFRLYAHR